MVLRNASSNRGEWIEWIKPRIVDSHVGVVGLLGSRWLLTSQRALTAHHEILRKVWHSGKVESEARNSGRNANIIGIRRVVTILPAASTSSTSSLVTVVTAEAAIPFTVRVGTTGLRAAFASLISSHAARDC